MGTEVLRQPLLSGDVKNERRKQLVKCATKNGKDWQCGGAPCSWAENGTAERSKDMKKLTRAVTFCILFMILEVYGGIRAGSLAILTDAAHLLSDVASFAISLFAIWAGGWEANLRQTFGFYRLEILGALVSIQIIWLITGIILYEAFVRLLSDQDEVDGRLMFIIASLGLVVNLAMMLLLDHGHGHSHGSGHGHSHGNDQEHSHGHHNQEDRAGGHRHHHYDSHEHLGDEHHSDHHHHHERGHKHHPVPDHEHHDDEIGGNDKQITFTHSNNGTSNHVEQALHQGHRTECVQENITKGRGSISGETIIVCICNEIDGQPSGSSGLPERSVRVTVDHGGEHDDHRSNASRNINVQGAYLHVLGDLIQSIGVMIGGAVIWYNPAWKIVDLACTFFFSIIVLWTTIKLLRDILEVLMESTPREVDAGALQTGLEEIQGVIAVHELHIWAITVGKVLLACHVTIEPDADADDVLQEVMHYCDKKFNISHVTIQIERSKE